MHALFISVVVGGDGAAVAVVVKCYNLTINCCTNVHCTEIVLDIKLHHNIQHTQGETAIEREREKEHKKLRSK